MITRPPMPNPLGLAGKRSFKCPGYKQDCGRYVQAMPHWDQLRRTYCNKCCEKFREDEATEILKKREDSQLDQLIESL